MGQYVYEQLISVEAGNSAGQLIGELNIDSPIILRAELIGIGTCKSVNVVAYSNNIFDTDVTIDDFSRSLYLRVVYTSMPEEGEYYTPPA